MLKHQTNFEKYIIFQLSLNQCSIGCYQLMKPRVNMSWVSREADTSNPTAIQQALKTFNISTLRPTDIMLTYLLAGNKFPKII